MTSMTINAAIAGFAEDTDSLRAQRRLRSSVNLQHEAIISEFDAGGQLRRGLGVAEIVADVGEIRAVDADAARRLDRFADAEMGRVRALAQRVDDHRPHA